jgi:hypothetical protein
METDGLVTDPERELGDILEDMVQKAARLVFQSALKDEVKDEVTDFLGRDRYAGSNATTRLSRGQ